MKEQKNLTIAAYDTIKMMMINYDIIPGQRLVFVDLAKQLGVSRTPINNALSILAKEGYLDFVPNQGYSVHRLTMSEFKFLYEFREILELGSIGKAIRQITEEKFKKVEERMNEYKESITDRTHRKLFILDTDFHAGIIEMAGNPILVERYRDICQKIFLRFRIEHLPVERINEIIIQHQSLLEALLFKDVTHAKELIKKHNRYAMNNLIAHIFSDEEKQKGLLR
ncbi:GntR family transcriptional regulator [Desulfobacterales bacterium HSG16]|nr:GntR family transcriptional regulator [Desulfobacterales bacterium HSG16]